MPKLKKEKWGKPKLIVLTRGKPEERVLSACKFMFFPSDVMDVDDGCRVFVGGCIADCWSIGAT